MRAPASQQIDLHIPSRSRVFCVSHNDDPDGLASAALVRCATRCQFALSGYEDIEKMLANAPRALDWLVVTDLGLDEKRVVISRLPEAARHVLYVDHHSLSSHSKRALRKARVIVRHSLKDCASVLVWGLLRNQLPPEAIGLAAYGAVTDPPASGYLTREVLLRTSRNLDMYEGHMLALALSSRSCTNNLREEIVKRLASLQLPHEIGPLRRLADKQAAMMVKIQKQLHDRAQVRGRVAVARAGRLALGVSSELLLGFPSVVASLVYDRVRSPSRIRISVRGTDECNQHLGKLMLRTARKFDGAGGGHALAAGAIVPSSRFAEFLESFVRAIGH
jgi:hypothetical protein